MLSDSTKLSARAYATQIFNRYRRSLFHVFSKGDADAERSIKLVIMFYFKMICRRFLFSTALIDEWF